MGKRVLISTFNNSLNNYGAIFQSYALAQTLKRLGHEPQFLTLDRRTVQNPAVLKQSLLRRIKGTAARLLLPSNQPQRQERAKKFVSFVKTHQDLVVYHTTEDLSSDPPEADVYLSGSDQVWNPRNLHPEMFHYYVSEDAVLASYAASMGNETIPEENKDLFAGYIRRYDSVSVREDTMIPIIEQLTEKTVHQHIDPVFLLTREDWLSLSKPYKPLKFDKYILMYMIEFDRSLIRKFRKLRKETGLPIVLVTLSGRKTGFADQVVMDASPEEFLSLLAGADMMVASSFHGCALSIVFQKPFLSIPGKDKPTRILSMLRHFHLERQNSAEITRSAAEVDYSAVSRQIDLDRKEAEAYLTEVCSMEK